MDNTGGNDEIKKKKKKASSRKKVVKKASKTTAEGDAKKVTKIKKVKKAVKKIKRFKRIEFESLEPEEQQEPVVIEKTTLSPEVVEQFREMLLAKRRELVGDMDVMTEDALKHSRSESAGDLSYMPIHMADIGSDNYEQEFTVELIANERKVVKEIDEALERVHKGVYGMCLATGNAIGITRLTLKPWAKYCVAYLNEMEKKAKKRRF